MKRRKIGRKTAKARVKVARRNAPKGAGVRAAAAKDTDAAQIQRERDEALQQQAATAEILKLISSSPADTQPVLDAIVRSGLKLFPDAAIFIALPDGDKLRAAAFVATDPNRAKMWAHQWPIPLTREYMHSLAFLDRKTVDIPDAREAPPELAVGAKNFLPTGYRALTIMPMMRGRTVIGTLSVVRLAPGPLSDRQVAALKTYATQAVIAIENTRLLNELRQRTDDLSESLEQQTATSAVLKVISSAPGELQPVFDAILKNATRICGAKIGILFRYEGGAYSALAMLGVTPAYAEYLNSSPIRPGPATGLGRVADTKQTIQIVDTQAEHVYAEREPLRVATAELGGARSLLNVPMLKDGILVGAIGIYRQEVRPFTHKQVELVTNFAAQAVIAIENTRVLNELRESLQQQGATSDVLKVISRSTFDLQTVLDALTESAARLCAADIANIWLLDGSACRLAASYQTIESGQKDYLASLPLGPSRGSCVGRTLLEARTVHIHDIRDDPEYELETSRLEGYRTMLGVPLLREGTPIGVIALVRSVRQPFT
ncbi:MAG TPA: GAF domain-containing protein, partial [Pseudolabrys sp.]|nr:GAF domain-containing protein [Pseudolabrys sp.]